MRNERIKRNKEYLAKLGLDIFIPMKKEKSHKKRNIGKPTSPSKARRSSKRIKSQVVGASRATGVMKHGQEESTVDDFDDFVEDLEDSRNSSWSTRTLRISQTADVILSEEERKVLEKNRMDQNYLEKFREFLVYHDKISDQNERNVMRQVTKLANGEGVRYESQKYGWPEGCYFMKGTRITPLSDIVDLLHQAAEAENKYGVDRGNGWLLRHPLKKLLLFQQFCLKNVDFLTSKVKLAKYCEKK